eukprot:SM000054S18065  [mRNA]  locus=s54:113751:118094:- [translate_table: standard]
MAALPSGSGRLASGAPPGVAASCSRRGALRPAIGRGQVRFSSSAGVVLQSLRASWLRHCSGSARGARRAEQPSKDQGGRRAWLLLVGALATAALLVAKPAPLGSYGLVPPAGALTEENLVFLEAWRTIDRAYIDKTFNGQTWFRYREDALKNTPMNNREQTYAAIRKMLATLDDPFTRFLEPEKFNSLRSGTQGAVTGVGLEVGFDTTDLASSAARLVVVSPVAGGPANRAGIQPGDEILAIDQFAVSGLGLYEVAQRLQGPPATEVELTVLRKGSAVERHSFTLTREKISLNPVTWQLCEKNKVGYIRLTTFNQNSAERVRDAIEQLREKGATSFVLDIRNNSGGLFPAGIEIAKMWLNSGVIVYIADNQGVRDIYDTDGALSIATTEPLAVLVNKGTASASEILAGALKDNKRATILGDNTFGKGKIQSVFELSDGSGLAVTIARYETPAHIDIDKVGITPDRPLPDSLPLDADHFCSCLSAPAESCSITPSALFSRSSAPTSSS